MALIETCPPDVWAEMMAERDREIREAFSPDRFDAGAVEEAVGVCYEAVGKPAPRVWWCDSPTQTVLIYSLLKRGSLGGNLRANLGDSLGGNLEANLGDNLWFNLDANLRANLRANLEANLGANLGANLEANLGANLGANLRANLEANLGANLRNNLRDNLGDNLGDNLRNNLRDNLRDNLRNTANSAYWGYYLLYGRIGHMIPELPDPNINQKHFDALLTVCTQTPWWIPTENVCFVTRPHVTLERNNRWQLHNNTGPAWAWSDGTGIWALNGIRVPEWVVMNPDPERFLSEIDNTEQRRVAFEHYGWDKAVDVLNLEPVDVHPDPCMGVLYRLPDSLVSAGEGAASLLVCRNASPDRDGSWRMYGLLADGACLTVVEAQESLNTVHPDLIGVTT